MGENWLRRFTGVLLYYSIKLLANLTSTDRVFFLNGLHVLESSIWFGKYPFFERLKKDLLTPLSA